MAEHEVYEFGEFVLDVPERRLLKGERIVPLPAKAYDLLVALVRESGRLITKGALLECVWPDSHVEEEILAVHVSNLRKALDDRGGDHRFIESRSPNPAPAPI